jgi:hypothetical protein
MANEEKEKENKIVMSFLTPLQLQKVIKKKDTGRVAIERRRGIECWRCGRKGTISFSYIGRKGKRAYVYCVHSGDKCYLGRAEDFLGDLLVKIREWQKGEKNEGKEQQELGGNLKNGRKEESSPDAP